MNIFQDKLLTRTYCDEAGDYAAPKGPSPQNGLTEPSSCILGRPDSSVGSAFDF